MEEKQIFKAKFHEEKQEILAPVLVPNEVDFDGHTYSEEEVSKAKENFVKYCNKANLQHRYSLSKDQAEFTEHYITPADMTINEQVVKKGTWMARMSIKSKALWQAVKDKVFTGFSVQGTALHQAIVKAKVAGRTETKAKYSLADFRFDKEGMDCHIGLVDEAANATEILVMKTKKQEEQTPVNKETEPDKGSVKPNKKTETNMSEDKNKELELEVKKSKEAQDALELEIKKEKEAKEQLELQVKKFKEEKEAAEKESFISKAKELKNIVKDEEAEALFVVKSMCPDQYEVISKALDSANNMIDKMEVVAEGKGSSDKGALNGTLEERVVMKAKELQKNDSKLSGPAARDKARQIMRKEGTYTQD
jgi:hypothetical protein